MRFLRLACGSDIVHVSSGEFVSEKQWCHVRRNIDSFVILVGLKGKAYIQQADEKYELVPQSALLLLPHTTHFGYKISEPGISYYWCHFYCQGDWEVIDEDAAVDALMKAKGFDQRRDIIIPIFSFYPKIGRMDILFHYMSYMSSSSNIYAKTVSDYILSAILVELAEQAGEKYTFMHVINEREALFNDRFNKLLEWIRANMDCDITLDEVAQRFNYSPLYLSKIIKKKTGLSFKEYLIMTRLNKAKEMLVNSDETIKEIAYKVGFSDEKYFMRIFKRLENITPTQFRNAYNLIRMDNGRSVI